MRYKLTTAVVISCISLSYSCNENKIDKAKTLAVTIEPQKYFLESIVGDHYKVDCIMSSGANPESADFTPAQMMSIDKSIAYFKIGYMGIENALIEKVGQSKADLKVIDCSEGIEMVGEVHVHEDEECTHHHGHDGGDPHTWSSVKSAKVIADNMYRAIVKMDKVNEADYTKNYNMLIAKINDTDSIIKSYLAKAPSRSFIIYHPALSYFADEYGFTQLSIENEGKNPSPSQLKELIDKAKMEGVKVVFIQQEFDTKNAETVADAIGGKAVVINLLSYNWSEEMIKIAKSLALE